MFYKEEELKGLVKNKTLLMNEIKKTSGLVIDELDKYGLISLEDIMNLLYDLTIENINEINEKFTLSHDDEKEVWIKSNYFLDNIKKVVSQNIVFLEYFLSKNNDDFNNISLKNKFLLLISHTFNNSLVVNEANKEMNDIFISLYNNVNSIILNNLDELMSLNELLIFIDKTNINNDQKREFLKDFSYNLKKYFDNILYNEEFDFTNKKDKIKSMVEVKDLGLLSRLINEKSDIFLTLEVFEDVLLKNVVENSYFENDEYFKSKKTFLEYINKELINNNILTKNNIYELIKSGLEVLSLNSFIGSLNNIINNKNLLNENEKKEYEAKIVDIAINIDKKRIDYFDQNNYVGISLNTLELLKSNIADNKLISFLNNINNLEIGLNLDLKNISIRKEYSKEELINLMLYGKKELSVKDSFYKNKENVEQIFLKAKEKKKIFNKIKYKVNNDSLVEKLSSILLENKINGNKFSYSDFLDIYNNQEFKTLKDLKKIWESCEQQDDLIKKESVNYIFDLEAIMNDNDENYKKQTILKLGIKNFKSINASNSFKIGDMYLLKYNVDNYLKQYESEMKDCINEELYEGIRIVQIEDLITIFNSIHYNYELMNKKDNFKKLIKELGFDKFSIHLKWYVDKYLSDTINNKKNIVSLISSIDFIRSINDISEMMDFPINIKKDEYLTTEKIYSDIENYAKLFLNDISSLFSSNRYEAVSVLKTPLFLKDISDHILNGDKEKTTLMFDIIDNVLILPNIPYRNKLIFVNQINNYIGNKDFKSLNLFSLIEEVNYNLLKIYPEQNGLKKAQDFKNKVKEHFANLTEYIEKQWSKFDLGYYKIDLQNKCEEEFLFIYEKEKNNETYNIDLKNHLDVKNLNSIFSLVTQKELGFVNNLNEDDANKLLEITESFLIEKDMKNIFDIKEKTALKIINIIIENINKKEFLKNFHYNNLSLVLKNGNIYNLIDSQKSKNLLHNLNNVLTDEEKILIISSPEIPMIKNNINKYLQKINEYKADFIEKLNNGFNMDFIIKDLLYTSILNVEGIDNKQNIIYVEDKQSLSLKVLNSIDVFKDFEKKLIKETLSKYNLNIETRKEEVSNNTLRNIVSSISSNKKLNGEIFELIKEKDLKTVLEILNQNNSIDINYVIKKIKNLEYGKEYYDAFIDIESYLKENGVKEVLRKNIYKTIFNNFISFNLVVDKINNFEYVDNYNIKVFKENLKQNLNDLNYIEDFGDKELSKEIDKFIDVNKNHIIEKIVSGKSFFYFTNIDFVKDFFIKNNSFVEDSFNKNIRKMVIANFNDFMTCSSNWNMNADGTELLLENEIKYLFNILPKLWKIKSKELFSIYQQKSLMLEVDFFDVKEKELGLNYSHFKSLMKEIELIIKINEKTKQPKADIQHKQKI